MMSKTRLHDAPVNMQNETNNLGSKTDICLRWCIYPPDSFFSQLWSTELFDKPLEENKTQGLLWNTSL